jgi:hypothetical protein
VRAWAQQEAPRGKNLRSRLKERIQNRADTLVFVGKDTFFAKNIECASVSVFLILFCFFVDNAELNLVVAVAVMWDRACVRVCVCVCTCVRACVMCV